jgi:hypothetical protein
MLFLRDVAEAANRRLSTMAARVRSCGICGGQSGTGGRFSPSTSVPRTKHSTDFSRLIIIHHPGVDKMHQYSGLSNNWLRSTPPQREEKNVCNFLQLLLYAYNL